jgi:hypothetical protein
MTLTTKRLDIVPINPGRAAVPLLKMFNSNPGFLEATEQFSGKRQYTSDDVEAFCWRESRRVNGHRLAIRMRVTDDLVGPTALRLPTPDDDRPLQGNPLNCAPDGPGWVALAQIPDLRLAYPELLEFCPRALAADR